MKIIKAEIKERYLSKKENDISGIEEITHETRYFSSLKKFQTWFNTFKEQLWCDEEDKVNLAEGIFIVTKEMEIDNLEQPHIECKYAKFRPDISFYYAKPTGSN